MPELGADIPLSQCLAEGALAGYEGFELGHKFPRSPELLRPLLAQHDLALVSGWYSTRLLERSAEEEIAAMESHLSLLRAMACDVMVVAEVSGCVHGDMSAPLSSRPQLSDTEWPEFGIKLQQLAGHMSARGVRMAYHHHMGTVVQTVSDIERLMEVCNDSVGLLLDTGHLFFAGGDPVALAQRFKHRIVHVHCKDVRQLPLERALASDNSFLAAVLDGVFTVPGDGLVDFPGLASLLREAAYQGWLVVEAEQDPDKADPITYARMGFKYLQQLRIRLGL